MASRSGLKDATDRQTSDNKAQVCERPWDEAWWIRRLGAARPEGFGPREKACWGEVWVVKPQGWQVRFGARLRENINGPRGRLAPWVAKPLICSPDGDQKRDGEGRGVSKPSEGNTVDLKVQVGWSQDRKTGAKLMEQQGASPQGASMLVRSLGGKAGGVASPVRSKLIDICGRPQRVQSPEVV
jgi:hypothetical protein